MKNEHSVRYFSLSLQPTNSDLMPSNKNALIRYKFLDEMLSDRHHFYDINDLTEKCNEKLLEAGFREVTRRCIEKDIVYLQETPFNAPIKRFRWNGKKCVAYKDTSFSIFKQEMSNEERNLLREVLNTIGQFDGLNHFEWLDKFKIGLGIEERRQIISFSHNPYLVNSNLLGVLFDYISNEVVIRLSYHTFADAKVRSIDFHPYLLKQYNDRWYLLGAADSDKKILTFALDRIDKIESLPEKKYFKCPEDFYNRFEDIVGVTLYENRPVEHILFWVSDTSKDYVITKPIHESQIQYQGEIEKHVRNQYPQCEDGCFFSIDCIKNYELIRTLCSFGKELIVLCSNGTIVDDIQKRVSDMYDNYSRLRT